jgi:N-acetylglucosamine repressor
MTKATRQTTKTLNSQLVLKLIYDRGKISRADVARETQLTRTTVSKVVAQLMSQGLVEEVGHGESAGGKSPILLSVVNNSYHIIGIDLASDEFRGAVVNLRGEIIRAVAFPISSPSGDAALALVYKLIDTLLASSDRPVLGLGFGTPGLIDTEEGIVRQAVNLDWQGLALGQLLKARYHLPVYLVNDCQAAALAEFTYGGWHTARNLAVIKIGQGIGAGLVLDGRLFVGDGSSAGEIGHMLVVENGLPCRCGHTGCLETVASVGAIVRRAQALARASAQSPLSLLPPEAITLEALSTALEAGDPVARQVTAEAGQSLGRAVAALVSTLNLHQVLLIGSVTTLGMPLLKIIQQEMRRQALATLAEATKVQFGHFGLDVVILGASALLLTHELGLSFAR